MDTEPPVIPVSDTDIAAATDTAVSDPLSILPGGDPSTAVEEAISGSGLADAGTMMGDALDWLTGRHFFTYGDHTVTAFNLLVAVLCLLLALVVSLAIRIWLKQRLFKRWEVEEKIQTYCLRSVNTLCLILGFYYALLAIPIPIDELLNKTVLFNIGATQVTLSSLITAAVFIVITVFISRWVRMLMQNRLFARWKIDEGAQFMFMRLTHYLVMVAGILVAVQSLGIQPTMFVGMLAVLGVGIGFGLQNLTSNFISGIILLFEQPIKVGDRITVEEIWGDVVQINLRTTVVNSTDNISIIIPNSKLLENNLINWSYGDARIRIRVPVGVAYGSDVDLVTKAILEAATETTQVLTDPAPDVWFREFGDSSLNFELICWLPTSNIRDSVINKINRAIDRNFRQYNVEIPFPQRDLHIRPSDAELRVRIVNDDPLPTPKPESEPKPEPKSQDAPQNTDKPDKPEVSKKPDAPTDKPDAPEIED